MEQKGESLFKKVIGGTPEEKKKVLKTLERMRETFADEKINEKEKEIIKNTEFSVDEIIKSYGIESNISADARVHLLKPDNPREAYHAILGQYVALKRHPSDIGFSSRLAHELFHLKSPKIAQIDQKGMPDVYRSGIVMYDRKDNDKKFFGRMNEAITAELNKKFYFNYICNNPLYQEELEAIDTIKEWSLKSLKSRGVIDEREEIFLSELIAVPNAKEIADVLNDSQKSDKFKFDYIDSTMAALRIGKKLVPLERYYERKEFNKLLDEIIKRSDGEFKNKEELFGEFVRANYTMHYLKIAKIIEKSFGEGAFRRLAEEFKG